MMRFFILIMFILMIDITFSESLTVVFSSGNNGTIRSCDCPIEPLGGLAERATLFNKLKQKHENIIFLDAGDILNPFLADERDLVVAKVYSQLGYSAICPGDQEFIGGMDFFYKNIYEKLPLVSANLSLGDSTKIIPKYRILRTKNNLKIGITGINYHSGFKILFRNEVIKENDLMISRAIDSLKKAIELLKAENVDLIIVLAHLSREGVVKLLDNVEGYHIFINGENTIEFKYPRLVADKIYLETGYDGEKISQIDLEVSNKEIKKYDYKLLPVNSEYYHKEEKIDSTIKHILDSLNIED